MGKKKSYKLKEHERYEKRVDIFRTVQQSSHKAIYQMNSAVPPKIIMMKGSNGFVNQSYLASDLSLEQQKPDHKKTYVNDDPIWTSRSSFIASPSVTKNAQVELQYPKSNPNPMNIKTPMPNAALPLPKFLPSKAEFYPPILSEKSIRTNNKKRQRRKQFLISCSLLFLILVILALIVALILILFKSDSSKTSQSQPQSPTVRPSFPTGDAPIGEPPIINSYSNQCVPECDSNSDKFCVQTNAQNVMARCECKPGYTSLDETNKCEKILCSDSYYPYTFINNYANSSQLALPYNTKFLKPYCCPHKTYLTSSCCGISVTPTFGSKRIVGGKLVTQSVFPWVVYVSQMYRASLNNSLAFISNCSGSLISDKVVLTAAHCLELDTNLVKFNSEFPNLASIMRVFVGLRNLSDALSDSTLKNNQIRVRKILVHPKYNSSTFDNDLALIYLDKAVIRNEDVDYICLYGYSHNDSIVNNIPMFTAGWGSTNPSWRDLQFPDSLYYIDANLYPMDTCTYIFPGSQYRYLFNEVTHVCAGHEDPIVKDTCYGDSGAPLMVQLKGQWFIYGVLSYGSQPDCAKGPAMYTRISHYFDWISANSI